jgi:predicted ArsR family transcriptional regulator
VSRWERNFFATTRGQIVALLRRTRQTVDDLAATLGLTDNAVRAHLLRLERDGLVQQRGVRRGERRPSLIYELTPEAEELFPKAYAPVLGRLAEVLAERSSPDELEALLRETGRRLGERQPGPSGDRRERLQGAAELLSSLGGLAEVEASSDGRLRLRGFSCPLGELVPEHPELCGLAEALVAEASGLEVRECCQRDADRPPQCQFEVVE